MWPKLSFLKNLCPQLSAVLGRGMGSSLSWEQASECGWMMVVLHRIHSSPHAGHPGKNTTLLQAWMLYYWPTMRIDIINYIDKCLSWAENHDSVARPVPIKSYPMPTEPWETIAIDLLKLPLTTEGHKYLLVCIDHFSRFCILVPFKDKTATSVASALIDEVFCKFNMPKTILSDNGTEFNNSVLDAICKEYGITKTNIIAYHPASNGLVERQNRKIIQHLRTLVANIATLHLHRTPIFTTPLNEISLNERGIVHLTPSLRGVWLYWGFITVPICAILRVWSYDTVAWKVNNGRSGTQISLFGQPFWLSLLLTWRHHNTEDGWAATTSHIAALCCATISWKPVLSFLGLASCTHKCTPAC